MNKRMTKQLQGLLGCFLLSVFLWGFTQETDSNVVEDGVVRASASVTITLPSSEENASHDGVTILANPASMSFVSQDDSPRQAVAVSNALVNQVSAEDVDDGTAPRSSLTTANVVRASASARITFPTPESTPESMSEAGQDAETTTTAHISANPTHSTFVSEDSSRSTTTASNTLVNQLAPDAENSEPASLEPVASEASSETSATESVNNAQASNETAVSTMMAAQPVETAGSETPSTESINQTTANATAVNEIVGNDTGFSEIQPNDAVLETADVNDLPATETSGNDPASTDSISESTNNDRLGVQEFVDNARRPEAITGETFALPVAADAASEAVEEARAVTELDPEVFAIAKELRCPVCRAESVAGSSAPISIEMRQIIQEKLEAGESREDILAYFQERYNDYILLNPPKRGIHLIVWIAPLLAALVALWLFWRFMKRWTRQAETLPETAADEVARVRALLEQQATEPKEQADD